MPYLVDDDGTRVLLITSRQTGRWVVPKGNPIAGLAPHEAAAQEAWEEAGVRGVASPTPLGTFRYAKRRRGGTVEASVRLFPLAVVEQHDDWPERGQRRLQWLPLPEAARAVDEPALRALIAGFRASPQAPLARRLLLAVIAGLRPRSLVALADRVTRAASALRKLAARKRPLARPVTPSRITSARSRVD